MRQESKTRPRKKGMRPTRALPREQTGKKGKSALASSEGKRARAHASRAHEAMRAKRQVDQDAKIKRALKRSRG